MEVRVLLLEDNPGDAELVMRVLAKSELPHTLRHVSNRQDYLHELKNFNPDIVLSDYNLISYNGIHACSDMNHAGISRPFILITGTLTDEVAYEIASVGIEDFLLKDRLSRLPKAISGALEKWNTKKENQKNYEEIISNERRFRALTENIYDAILLIDRSGKLIYQSPSVKRITGFDFEEVKDGLVFNQIHPDDLEDAVDQLRKAYHNPENPQHGTFRIIHKLGHYIYVEGTISNMVNAENINTFIINYRDITERKLSQEKLLQSEQLLTEAQQLAKVGNWNANLKQSEIFWSDGMRAIMGVGKDATASIELFIDCLHPHDRKRVEHDILMALQTGIAHQDTFRIIRQDNGEVRAVSSITKTSSDIHGSLMRMYGTIQDVTELKAAEEQLAISLQDLERRVEARTLDLSIKNKNITDSINYAQRLQKALFRDTDLESRFSNSFVFNRPQNIVGGDFYWFLEKKQKLMLACVDCTGHGVPGAFMSIIGIDLLNKIVGDKNHYQPSMVLKLMDEGIRNSVGRAREEIVMDGMDLAFCTIDPLASKIYFAGAMNSIVLISDGEIKTHKGSRFGLGGYLESTKKNFETHEISYKEGDQLFLFSDGYRDQLGGVHNKKLKRSKLEEILQKISYYPAWQQKENLIEMFDEWKGSNEQTDDVMVIGLTLPYSNPDLSTNQQDIFANPE